MYSVVPTRASSNAASVGFKIMYEDGHTVCDFCDRDIGTFYKYKEKLYKGKIFEGEDMCEYCWRDLN